MHPQNALQTRQLMDLPHKYVRYHYQLIEKQAYLAIWFQTTCTPGWSSYLEMSWSYAESIYVNTTLYSPEVGEPRAIVFTQGHHSLDSIV